MNHINRLLRQARNAVNGKGKYIIGFVDYDPQKKKFTASGTIWNGVKESGGDRFYSEHDTQDEAIAACEAVAAQNPGSENINFIIDDLSFPATE